MGFIIAWKDTAGFRMARLIFFVFIAIALPLNAWAAQICCATGQKIEAQAEPPCHQPIDGQAQDKHECTKCVFCMTSPFYKEYDETVIVFPTHKQIQSVLQSFFSHPPQPPYKPPKTVF